jgi:hypothetical protein
VLNVFRRLHSITNRKLSDFFSFRQFIAKVV